MPNLPSDQFQADLTQGKKAEHYICQFLKQFFPDAQVFDGYKKEWDIEVPSRGVQIEVKYDRLSKTTGNVAIELQYFNSASGIMATTAQIWCIIFGTEDGWFFTFVEVAKLKERVQGKREVWGGDEHAAKMALLPVPELLEISKVYAIDKYE